MPRKSSGSSSAPINDQGGLLINPLVYILQVARDYQQDFEIGFIIVHWRSLRWKAEDGIDCTAEEAVAEELGCSGTQKRKKSFEKKRKEV
jgi:hypothetical protein